MPRVRDALNLDSIPAPSTLCKAFDRLEMAVWRVLLNVSLADLPLNGVTGIDASGFERAHASTHYTKRTNLTIQQLKTTLLVDTGTNAILDVHVTTTRKHDTQMAPQVVKRNAASIEVLTGDKGYDDQKLRRLSHDHDIRPLIKHREFTPPPQSVEYRHRCGLTPQSVGSLFWLPPVHLYSCMWVPYTMIELAVPGGVDPDDPAYVENPVTGERFRFHTQPTDPDTDPLELDLWAAPEMSPLAEHVHPRQDETFTVHAGTIECPETTRGRAMAREARSLSRPVPHIRGRTRVTLVFI